MPDLQHPLLRIGPLPFFPGASLVAAGYTQRMLPVVPASFSGQRTVQTYMATVSVLVLHGQWLYDLSDTSPHRDMQGRSPYQDYHIYTTSLSSPDGDIPFKHGDYFIPTGNLVGLVANTQHPIRGVLPYDRFYDLVIERKL